MQYLEAFGIDPRHFAQTVQRMVAGSASVVQSEQKSRGQDVHVQGNQIDFIVKHLLGQLSLLYCSNCFTQQVFIFAFLFPTVSGHKTPSYLLPAVSGRKTPSYLLPPVSGHKTPSG